MWFDLVVPVNVFVHRFESVLLLFVDAVEAFRLLVGLWMVGAHEICLIAFSAR